MSGIDGISRKLLLKERWRSRFCHLSLLFFRLMGKSNGIRLIPHRILCFGEESGISDKGNILNSNDLTGISPFSKGSSSIYGEDLIYVNLIFHCFDIYVQQRVLFICFLQVYNRFYRLFLFWFHNFNACCSGFSPLVYIYLTVHGENHSHMRFT